MNSIKIDSQVDLPEITGKHRKFRTLVTSYIGNVEQKQFFLATNQLFTYDFQKNNFWFLKTQ